MLCNSVSGFLRGTQYSPAKQKERINDFIDDEKDENKLADAIKNFQSIMLTGNPNREPLSDEEREILEYRLDKILENLQYDIRTEKGMAEFRMHLSNLILEFGKASDFVQFVQDFVYEKTSEDGVGVEIKLPDIFAENYAQRGNGTNIQASNTPNEEDEDAILGFMRSKIGSNPVLNELLNHSQTNFQ